MPVRIAPTPTGLTHSPAPSGPVYVFRPFSVGFIPQARDYSSFAPSGQLLPSCPSRTLTRPWGCPYFGDSRNIHTPCVRQKVWNMLSPYLEGLFLA